MEQMSYTMPDITKAFRIRGDLVGMKQIDEVINRIQEKWGHQALQSARHLSVQDKVYPSGFLSLDGLIGGIPCAQITELVGRPTSGMTTLVYHSLAQSQKQGANVVIIDSLSHLDMNAAAASGVNLEKLILVEIEEIPLLFNLLRELLHSGIVNYLLVNLLGLRQGHLSLRPLMNELHHSDCALVLLLPQSVQSESASLRLRIQRQKWLQQNGDIVGCLSSVKVEKQRTGNVGAETLLLLPFEQEIWA
jgi:hypothetical protein